MLTITVLNSTICQAVRFYRLVDYFIIQSFSLASLSGVSSLLAFLSAEKLAVFPQFLSQDMCQTRNVKKKKLVFTSRSGGQDDRNDILKLTEYIFQLEYAIIDTRH